LALAADTEAHQEGLEGVFCKDTIGDAC